MIKRIHWMVCLVIFATMLQAEVEIYLAPKGGFHPNNNQRTITLKDGSQVPANLNNTLLELIDSAEEGSTIKIAMYAFGFRPVQDALIDAAKNRKIKVKLVLDAIADWTQEMRAEFKVRILAEYEDAKEKGRLFDFQLKEIYPQAMVDRDRFKKIEDGTMIYGTMHEKFGVFYPKGCNIPLSGFCGSANISWSAGQVFAENRVIFKNEPSLGRQLAEEFARLWNEFGTPVTDNCQSENFLPSYTDLGQIQILSNAKPTDEENFLRLDELLMQLMEQVDRSRGTLDVAIFSFTHLGLADKLLEMAERYSRVKVRILMDQTQMEDSDDRRGVLGPYMERVAEFKDLKNFEVRYKWRSNTYAINPETNACELIHWRNLLLHHKGLVVNRKRMGLGSYNWSSSAEFRNFENIMFFNGDVPSHQKIVDRFMNEFDFLWDCIKSEQPITAKIDAPQVVTGKQGRALRKLISAAFDDNHNRKIMSILDTNPGGCTATTLRQILGITEDVLAPKIKQLEQATLIFGTQQEQDILYQLTD